MKKQKLTDWFPADVKPVHEGAYEVRMEGYSRTIYSWWNGEKFCYRTVAGPQSAFDLQYNHTFCPGESEWRGLASDPNA